MSLAPATLSLGENDSEDTGKETGLVGASETEAVGSEAAAVAVAELAAGVSVVRDAFSFLSTEAI
jgi:hypothetical protein